MHRFISWANILPSFMKKTCCCFQQTLLVLNPLLLCLYIMLRKRSSLCWCFIWFHMNVDAVSQCESYYQGHFLHFVQCSIIKRNKGKIKMKKSGIFYVFHLYLVILKNSRCESSLSHRFDLLFFICNQKHMAALPVNFLNLSYHSSRSNTAVFATSQI